jgi:lactobin A/cerein 7B family class IIb bacteriocin
MSEMATTIDIAKGFRAGGACLAEVTPDELEKVEGGLMPLVFLAGFIAGFIAGYYMGAGG